MNDRIHRALDGEIDPETLQPEERTEYAALAGAVRDAIRPLHRAPAPDLTASVMSAISREGSTRGKGAYAARVLEWLFRPRRVEFHLRPVYALAGLMITILATGVAIEAPGRAGTPAIASGEALVFVQFRLELPGASSVSLAGSFTEWAPRIELVEITPGLWSALVPLQPGVHDYTFVVDDDTWLTDPLAPSVDDGFGGLNSRLFLTQPQRDA
jgi:hypothetical protein